MNWSNTGKEPGRNLTFPIQTALRWEYVFNGMFLFRESLGKQ